MDIHSAAQALGGDIAGPNTILCPGPGHSEEDRSLSVTFMGDTFVVNSYAGDDWRRCKDYVREALGGNRAILVRVLSDEERRQRDREKIRRALAVWETSQTTLPSQARTYLASRSIAYAGQELRWNSCCTFGKQILGCMVALVRNIQTNEPQAIHRTAIDGRGKKIGRMALGPIGDGAIKLFDVPDANGAIGIAEGIETALSIRELPGLKDVPVWSLLNANGVKGFPVLPGLRRVIIAADNDENGTGEKVADEARKRLNAAGIAVTILWPTEVGTDLNDEVMRRANA